MSNPSEYNLDIRVSISRPGYSSDRLSVDEQLTVNAANFMEMCSVLGQFHTLAEKIRAEGATT